MEIGEEERVREIGVCGHIFHCACLERWLKVKEICPLCKKVLSKYELDAEQFGEDPRRGEEEEEVEGGGDFGIEMAQRLNDTDEFYRDNVESHRFMSQGEDMSEGEEGLEEDVLSTASADDMSSPRLRGTNNRRRLVDRDILNIMNLERNMRSMSDRIFQLSRQIETLTGEVNSRDVAINELEEGTTNRREIDEATIRIQQRAQELSNLLENELL